MTPSREDLLERLKKATGPDRALDRELMLFEVPEFPRAVADLLEDDHFTPLTSSLDAALALVERVGPGLDITVSIRERGEPFYGARLSYYENGRAIVLHRAVAATAPLAVLIALLSALPSDSLGQEETGK